MSVICGCSYVFVNLRFAGPLLVSWCMLNAGYCGAAQVNETRKSYVCEFMEVARNYPKLTVCYTMFGSGR